MIVIPMAGMSSRFLQAGYAQPKYMLPLAGATLFAQTVRSFESLFEQDVFVFIYRGDEAVRGFIDSELRQLGVREARLVALPEPTAGQAHTVHLGSRTLPIDEPLTIFNIDTIRPGYAPPPWQADCDGWLEVFRGAGDHWSFAEPGRGHQVLRTTEKLRISELCSDGLYHFAQRRLFDDAFEDAWRTRAVTRGEFYVAPLYNHLIQRGLDIRFHEIATDEVLFCGTPQEYDALRADTAALSRLAVPGLA